MSGQVNDHALVKIVELYPILYDKDMARGQKNAELKDRAWQEVSRQLSASERACVTRWKSIRDRFGKEFRRVQEHPDEPTSWDMFPHLLFLKNHYKHGCARNEPLVEIKYEPKARKTRKSRFCKASEDENHNDYDIDPDELMTNQQLIALVKLHPVLYDRYMIRDSKNLTAKNDAWKDISESLGISEELCYKRWKKLRDRFSREYRHKKINPEKPMMWAYFQDLMFLEDHYRKGIPLNVETLQRRSKPPSKENFWGNDDSNNSLREQMEEEHMTVSTESESFSDTIHQQSMDELFIIPAIEETTQEAHKYTHTNSEPVETTSITIVETIDAIEPEQKLSCVISNIKTVLRDSQDCLKTLQQNKKQMETNIWHLQPDILQKMIVLLDGLSDEERNKAERKILQFLCECQIKALNNEDIDDVGNLQIY